MNRKEFEELEVVLIDTLEEKGFNGIDVSLEISLFEYGLLVKPSEDKKEFDCIIGSNSDDNGNFKEFSYASITKQFLFDFINCKEWVNKKDLKSFYESNDTNKKECLLLINEFSPMIINDIISYWGIVEFFDIGATDHIFLENYQYDCLNDYYDELTDLNDELKELETNLEELPEFDRDDYKTGFDEMLDDGESITVAGIEFEPSDILKECDPTAYRCYFNDYVFSYEDEYNNTVEEFETEIENKKEEITDKKQEILSQLEDIPQIDLEDE